MEKYNPIGKNKSKTNDKYAHWFYFGDWNFNEDGKLITIKKYNNESFPK
jgi:hypothetical protein